MLFPQHGYSPPPPNMDKQSSMSTQKTAQKPESTYQYPDIRKSRFFKLTDYQHLNQKFHQQLTQINRGSYPEHQQQQQQLDGSMMLGESVLQKDGGQAESVLTSRFNRFNRLNPESFVKGAQQKEGGQQPFQFFDRERLEERKRKTGFMFSCFNVFRKDNQSQERNNSTLNNLRQSNSRVLNQSQTLNNNTYNQSLSIDGLNNTSFYSTAKNNNNNPTTSQQQNSIPQGHLNNNYNPPSPRFFKKPSLNDGSIIIMSNSSTPTPTPNTQSPPTFDLSHSTVSLRKQPQPHPLITPSPTSLTPQQLNQTHEIKLDFRLNLKKPQFCMGAFSHTQSSFFRTGVDVNVTTPSLEDYRPFSRFLSKGEGDGSRVSGFGDSGSMNRGMESEMEESIFDRIKKRQSGFFNRKSENQQQQDNQAEQQQKDKQKNKPPTSYLFSQQPHHPHPTPFQQNITRALQLGLIEIDEQQISFIQKKEEDNNNEDDGDGNLLERSIFENYKVLLEQPEYDVLPVWEGRREGQSAMMVAQTVSPVDRFHYSNNDASQHPSPLISTFQLSYQWHPHHLSLLQSHSSLPHDSLYPIPTTHLFTLITQTLQGIENSLFLLDYDKMQWYIDLRGFRFEHVLRGSFAGVVEGVIQVANWRSRLEMAVGYMLMRPGRRVYYEVAKEVQRVLRVFEECLLELVGWGQQQERHEGQGVSCYSNNKQQHYQHNPQSHQQHQQQGLMHFLLNLQQLTPQIKLLYSLIISQPTILSEQLSYFSFDHRFLDSQFHLFQRILLLSRQSDCTLAPTHHLTKALLQASFKPILTSLTKILFQQTPIITSKDQMYLKYYYESTKELFAQVSRRMEVVRREEWGLYVVCKERWEMGIEGSVEGLGRYDWRWEGVFAWKYRQLQAYLTRMITQQHESRHTAQKQRQLQLSTLKRKLRQKTQSQLTQKLTQKSKRDQQLLMLKREIKEKEERRRLEELIEKEQERGYLLEDQLRRKVRLLGEKERLVGEGQREREEEKMIGQAKEKEKMIGEDMKMGEGQMQEEKLGVGEVDVDMVNQSKQPIDKPKKWNQLQQPQPNNNPQSTTLSHQLLTLPIVNEQQPTPPNPPDHQHQPKSPKSSRSRKIRKDSGKIKQSMKWGSNVVNYRRQGVGKIGFNRLDKKSSEVGNGLAQQNNQHSHTAVGDGFNLMNLRNDVGNNGNSNNHSQTVNFHQLCQKNKKLNFTPHYPTPAHRHPSLPPLAHTQSLQLIDSSSSLSQQSQSDDDDSSLPQQIQIEQQLYRTHLQSSNKQQHIPTNCVFQICIDKILAHQTNVINNCYEILVFQKYRFREVVGFMKTVFFSQNGQNHRTLLDLSTNNLTSTTHLKPFTQCFLFDNLPPYLSSLHPSFYNTRQQSLQQIQHRLIHHSTTNSTNAYYGEFNMITQNLEQYIGFQFANLPPILETHFSYIHLSKYMQIFSWILRIKHCEVLVSESWKLLNQYKKELFAKQKERSQMYGEYFREKYQSQQTLLTQLFTTRHLIQSFLTTYQNYIFFRVIEKEFKSLNKKIERHQLHDLQNAHIKLLDTIIRFAFVDNSTNNITKEIRRLLEFIREFRNIVDLVCGDDVMEEQKMEIRAKVRFVYESFRQNQKFFQALYFKT